MPATKNLVARPDGTAAAKRPRRVRRALHRVMRWRRVLRIAAQRLRPATVSTPRTVAWVQGLPPRGPSAVRIWQASWAQSATTVALGKANGMCSPISTCWTSRCAAWARLRTTCRLVWGSRCDVNIVDVYIDLAVDLARDSLEDTAEGVQ